MMAGMSGSFHSTKLQTRDDHTVSITCRMNKLLGTGFEPSPESVHVVSVDSRGAGEELLGVDQMTGTPLMHMYWNTFLRQPPAPPA